MAARRPTNIDEYIGAASPTGQAQLRRLYKLLKSVAPQAQEAIKWGTPFFVEPRFVFAFSAHKAHISFAPTAGAMEAFADELKQHQTTKGMLKIAYDQPLPEDLIRRMAQFCVEEVSARDGQRTSCEMPRICPIAVDSTLDSSNGESIVGNRDYRGHASPMPDCSCAEAREQGRRYPGRP